MHPGCTKWKVHVCALRESCISYLYFRTHLTYRILEVPTSLSNKIRTPISWVFPIIINSGQGKWAHQYNISTAIWGDNWSPLSHYLYLLNFACMWLTGIDRGISQSAVWGLGASGRINSKVCTLDKPKHKEASIHWVQHPAWLLPIFQRCTARNKSHKVYILNHRFD